MVTNNQKNATKKAVLGFDLRLVLLLIAVVFLSGSGVHSRVDGPRQQTRRVATQELDWWVAEELLLHRMHFGQSVDTTSFPEWPLFTEEYLLSLQVRRQSVIEWSRSLRHRPVIDFAGQMHLSIIGGSDLELINQIQGEVFEAVRSVEGADVILIEDSGCDLNEIITPASYVGISQETIRTLTGIDLPRDAIIEYMAVDPQAATRAIHELRTPVTCGEEWPIILQSRLLRFRDREEYLDSRNQFDQLGDGLTRLRSEIIVIRALEYLRSMDGGKAIIIQGIAHAADVERVADEYGIDLRIHVPPSLVP